MSLDRIIRLLTMVFLAFLLCVPVGCAQQQETAGVQRSDADTETWTDQPIETTYNINVVANWPGHPEQEPANGSNAPPGVASTPPAEAADEDDGPLNVTANVTSDWTTSNCTAKMHARGVSQIVVIEINTAGTSAAEPESAAQSTGTQTTTPTANQEPQATLQAQIPVSVGTSPSTAVEGTAAGQGSSATGGSLNADQSGDVWEALLEGASSEAVQSQFVELIRSWFEAALAKLQSGKTSATTQAAD